MSRIPKKKHFVPTKEKPIPGGSANRDYPEDIPSYPELRDELKPFSDRELIYELQMRRKIRRIAAIVEPTFITWQGQVTSIEPEPNYRTGSPYYNVRPMQTLWGLKIEKPFRVKSKTFKEHELPQVGDQVVLQYRINPKRPEQASFNESLIIENKGECKWVWLDGKNEAPDLPIYKHVRKQQENEQSE